MSADAEHTLVDLATFRPDGQCVLFIRPRRALSDEEMRHMMTSIAHFPIPGVRQMFVPHDIELMALGEAEMERIGYARIPVPVDRLINGEVRRFTSEQCANDFEARLFERTAP